MLRLLCLLLRGPCVVFFCAEMSSKRILSRSIIGLIAFGVKLKLSPLERGRVSIGEVYFHGGMSRMTKMMTMPCGSSHCCSPLGSPMISTSCYGTD